MTLAKLTTSAATGTRVRAAEGSNLERWDELVRGFANHRVVHTRAWIESLAACGCGTPLYLLFERDGDVVGCLPGLIGSLGGLKLFGSPREGWQTVSMGPAFDPARISSRELLQLAVSYLEQEHGVAHIEIMSTSLDPADMRGEGFEGESVFTWRAPLFPGDEARALKQLKDSARRNIKRAQRLGLETRIETDESFVDEHYAQLREVYLRGGHTIPFPKRRVLECFRHLQASGQLLAIGVYLPGGRVCIATGMFLVEGSEMLLWMWAHKGHYRWYRPTELMTWTAMQRAMALGCETLDFMGRGDFKQVFGAVPDETKWRWTRSRPKWIGTARRIAGAGFRLQQQLRGRASQWASRANGNGRNAGSAAACVMGDHDLVRALGLGDIPSVVVAPPGSAARYSRSTQGALAWTDSWDQPEMMIASLVEHGLAQSEPPVLFFQDDRSLLLVSRHRETLKQAFRFVIADAELIENLVDKSRFQQLADRLKLPVPPARAVNPAESVMPADLAFPLIVKPITRRNATWNPAVGDGKATRVDSAAELETLWVKLADARVAVLLQTCIDGPESSIESYHTYVDERGEVVAEFTGRKIRTWPVEYGDTSSLEITAASDVAVLGRDVVKRLKLRGVAKLDFKRSADGTLYLLEVNPRFTLWHHPAARAGVNIPALVYGDLTGRPRPVVAAARAGVRWVKPWTDFSAARSSGVSFSSWLPWMIGAQTKSAFAIDDPLPLVGAGLWRRLSRRAQSAPAPVAHHLIPNSRGSALTSVSASTATLHQR